MASHHHLSQHRKTPIDSPAKVFAKLKSKIQREAMCAQDPLCNVREKHGPRAREESFGMTENLKENQMFDYRNDVQALTISPISTPKKTGYSFSNTSSKPMDVIFPVTEMGHVLMSRNGPTPKKRAFLESTGISHPLAPVNKEQIDAAEPHRVRDMDGLQVTSATPVKVQTVDKLTSPAKMFSPMKKRLRKRPWERQEYEDKDDSEVVCQAQVRKSSTVFREDNNHKTCMEDLGNVQMFSAVQSNHLGHEPMFPPPVTPAKKRCFVIMERVPLMSPAKLFAYMKERESKREPNEVHKVSSSTRELFGDSNNFHHARDSPLSTPHNMAEMDDTAHRSVPASGVSVNISREESADSPTEPSEDVLIPSAQPQQVLLEDPLVLNSPAISIPKKKQAVFKRNNWPQSTKFPKDNVIYLKNWFLRKNRKGLFVDGIHREDNIQWHSNIILDRVSSSVLKTVSGRVYILVGKMNLDVDSGFPKWLWKKFVNGFPPNWKELYQKFLSESKDDPSRETERTTDGEAIIGRKKSEASSISLSVKRNRQKPFKTPDSCSPALSSPTKVSRSGRVIKPPLEYWKGGRVILDAHMNVTIHECYDTSICSPDTTIVSARKSQKPARVLPCSEGLKQSESPSDEPVRKVKPPLRKNNRAKVNHEEKPPSPPEPHVETINSHEEWSGRTTRSSKKSPTLESILYFDTVPQKQKEPEKASTQRSKKWTPDTSRPAGRGCKQSVAASPESPLVNDETLQQMSPEEEVSVKRKKQGKGVHRKAGKKAGTKSQPSHVSLSSQSPESSEDSLREQRKRTKVTKNSDAGQRPTEHKRNKCPKVSPPAKPLPKSSQSSKTHKANKDEDEWTEAELMKLQEAVSYYPKHMAGYWGKVARMVGTRSAEECHNQHKAQGTSQTPAKIAKKARKEKVEAPKDPVTDHPVISARVGTLKRKQQVRQFLETMPREDVDEVFSSTYMQKKRFEIPSMCVSDDHDFTVSDLEPLTPTSKVFPEVKTPQCLHITPGMMNSPNRNNDDKYVYQFQKRMRKNQFNVCKQARSSKTFTPTPSVKRTMRRCGNTENDTFVVWEMFPGKDVTSESEEEEDFYFSEEN